MITLQHYLTIDYYVIMGWAGRNIGESQGDDFV